MTAPAAPDPANWLSPELAADDRWIFELDARAAADAADAVRRADRPGLRLVDYRREDFDFGAAAPVFERAFGEAKHGRGIALVRNLPREQLDEREFELLTWGIGLHQGVGRPQGRTSLYVSPVRDVGVDYRSATGRGYNSSAELDYHTDRADVIVLSCYNQAVSGGRSLVTSTAAAYDRFVRRHPDLVHFLERPVHWSRQGEQRPGETASFAHPVVDIAQGRRFVRWNRNRVRNAQQLPGVPPIAADHWHALDAFDAVLREPDIEFGMYLRPGDMEILNGNATLHARTNYVDDDDPARRRLMFRLWLAVPDSPRMPESCVGVYGTVQAGAVRGGILGDAYDDDCRAFDRRQAAAFGMHYDDAAHR